MLRRSTGANRQLVDWIRSFIGLFWSNINWVTYFSKELYIFSIFWSFWSSSNGAILDSVIRNSESSCRSFLNVLNIYKLWTEIAGARLLTGYSIPVGDPPLPKIFYANKLFEQYKIFIHIFDDLLLQIT